MVILAQPVYINYQFLSMDQILRVFVQYQGVSPEFRIKQMVTIAGNTLFYIEFARIPSAAFL